VNVNTVSTFFATGAVLLAALVLFVAGLRLLAPVAAPARRLLDRIRAELAGYGLWLAWLMATVATLGSLYYSQIAHFIPCEYCWYQRIAMYPLAVILGIAAFKGDEQVRRYAYPLAITGGLISAYHYLIQHMPDLAAGTCSTMTPCTAALVWKFDFVSIPFMALVSFATILMVLALDRTGTAAQTDQDAASGPRQGAQSSA
jgi:disulfide bond formation protein DsbB